MGSTETIAVGDRPMPPEAIDALVDDAAAAVEALAAVDPTVLDRETMANWAEGIEWVRRKVDAAGSMEQLESDA
jgi:hypothetical protein